MHSYGEDFIDVRREDVETHGRLTTDIRLAFARCATCKSTLPVAVDPIEQPAYPSLGALITSAVHLAEEVASTTDAVCPECDGSLALEEVAYHAWHAGLARDLVIRWRPSEPKPAVFTWDFGTELVPARLGPADEQRLVRSAALRADAMSLEAFLFLNDQELASIRPGVEPKLAHLVVDGAILLLLDETVVPGGKDFTLKANDVFAIEVTHPAGRPTPRSGLRSRPTLAAPGPRFEVTIDDEVVATVGPLDAAASFSLELTLSDRDEEVEIELFARAGEKMWPLPLLGAGQTASIRVLEAGLVDAP